MATRYYPSNYGAADLDPNATAAGTANFTGNFPQYPDGSYTVVTDNFGTDPQTYTVTLGYTGPQTGMTITVTQTPYSDANHNETFYNSDQTGPILFLLTNGPVSSDVSYTFTGPSTPFVPSGTTTDPTCFVTGTRILTRRGEVAVEDLVVGDIAVTASGDTRPIIWIGHSEVACGAGRHASRPIRVAAHGREVACGAGRHASRPIRVAAHGFGPGRPARDLLLSPGHPILVGADADGGGGHLVPIMCLINGTTIERTPVNKVTYWHVELEAHDILLAEGLPAESYLDWGDRAFFTEGAEHPLANPDFVVPGLAARCRPVALDGQVVEAERRRLDGVFAANLAAACAWPDPETLSA